MYLLKIKLWKKEGLRLPTMDALPTAQTFIVITRLATAMRILPAWTTKKHSSNGAGSST
jgi:hypothetical protein